LITNNSTITLQAATANTLTVTPGAGNTGIQVESGSSLSNTAVSILSITTTNSGQIIDFSGAFTWLGGTFTATGNTVNVSGTVNQTTGTFTSAAAVGTAVNISGTWTMNSGTSTLLGGTKSGTFNMISGTLNMNNATYPTTFTSTSVLNHTGGTINGLYTSLTFEANATYNHLATTAVVTIPEATWDVDSDIFITGITTATGYGFQPQTSVANANLRAYGNVTINCSNQSVVTSIQTTASTTATYYFQINGDFNVVNTGTGSLRLKGATGGAYLTVNGLFTVNDDVFGTQVTSNSCTILANGGYQQTGGTFNLSTVAQACNMTVGGDYLLDAGTFTQTQTTVSTLTFNGFYLDF